MQFYKYHGAGNDFIMVDQRSSQIDLTDQALIARLCHRRFGIGADGLIALQDSTEADFAMLYFNADGRPGSMCGNGGRCIVAFAAHLGMVDGGCTFVAYDGLHRATWLPPNQVRLQMSPVHDIAKIGEDYYLDTGSPHYIRYTDDLSQIDVAREGRAIRHDARFGQAGTNVNFVSRQKDGHLQVLTYERGVEAETYACGTGVVAAAIAAHHSWRSDSRASTTRVITRGGTLSVELQHNERGEYHDIYLTGPVERVFQGVWA